MQLSPREVFVISRGLEDHRDSTVFYVRASIRNARTDELLDTVDLTNRGDNHRYTKEWQVPPDVSGQGYYIIITTSVYTDAGYTTKTALYGDSYDTYLVADRMNPNLGGMGGGADVDYKRIGKMITEAVKALPTPEPVKIPKTDLSPVLEAIRGIEIPEQKVTDLTEVVSKLEDVLSAAKDKSMKPEAETAMRLLPNLADQLSGFLNDFQEVHARMKELLDANGALHEKVGGLTEANSNESVRSQLEETATKAQEALTKIQEFFTKDMDDVKAAIESVRKDFEGIQLVVMDKKREEPEPKQPITL